MRMTIGVASAALAIYLSGAAIAATHSASPANASAPAATVENCRKAGNEVSALIDQRSTSPNLPSARAVFQVGIMECMEGDEVAANYHYQQAKNLLNDRQPAAPAAAPAPVRN